MIYCLFKLFFPLLHFRKTNFVSKLSDIRARGFNMIIMMLPWLETRVSFVEYRVSSRKLVQRVSLYAITIAHYNLHVQLCLNL